VAAVRAALYAGLYDTSSDGAPTRRRMAATHGVRLLNPDYREDDATGLRFALLEIE